MSTLGALILASDRSHPASPQLFAWTCAIVLSVAGCTETSENRSSGAMHPTTPLEQRLRNSVDACHARLNANVGGPDEHSEIRILKAVQASTAETLATPTIVRSELFTYSSERKPRLVVNWIEDGFRDYRMRIVEQGSEVGLIPLSDQIRSMNESDSSQVVIFWADISLDKANPDEQRTLDAILGGTAQLVLVDVHGRDCSQPSRIEVVRMGPPT